MSLGPRLLLGTRAGMSVEDVMAVVPGGRTLGDASGHDPDRPMDLVAHDDIELAGLEGGVRFSFAGGALVGVSIAFAGRGDQDASVLSAQSIVVMLTESHGPAVYIEDARSRGAGTAQSEWFVRGRWTNGPVVVDLDVAVRAGRAVGSLSAVLER